MPLFLQLVGAQLVHEGQCRGLPGACRAQCHVPLVSIWRMARGELLAAVAAQRAERIAREAFGMHAHEHVFPVADIALHKRHVVLAVERVHGSRVRRNVAVLRSAFSRRPRRARRGCRAFCGTPASSLMRNELQVAFFG